MRLGRRTEARAARATLPGFARVPPFAGIARVPGVARIAVIAGLAAAGCMQRPDVPALQAPAPDRARFVSVSGEGSFTVDPNQAHVELVLESDGATAKVAYGTGQQRLTDLKAALEAVGVRRPEMEAREYSLEETWTEADGALRKSYRMRQVIRVSVRDLVKLPETLGQAAVHGADSIRSVSFGYTNPAMLLERARERALEDARAKAKLLAEESQEQLGAVLNIVEEAAGPGGSDWLGDDDGSPYTFTVRLTATYALSDF